MRSGCRCSRCWARARRWRPGSARPARSCSASCRGWAAASCATCWSRPSRACCSASCMRSRPWPARWWSWPDTRCRCRPRRWRWPARWPVSCCAGWRSGAAGGCRWRATAECRERRDVRACRRSTGPTRKRRRSCASPGGPGPQRYRCDRSSRTIRLSAARLRFPLSARLPTQDAEPRGSAREVFATFLRLGLTSFGGPIAHLGYLRRECVSRRGWLDDARFAQLVALCQFLPGPASSQLGFALGLLRAGWRGALAAFVGFTLPSALAMFAFAALLPLLAGSPWLPPAVHGLKLLAVAVVAHGLAGIDRKSTRLNSSHVKNSYAVFCLKQKTTDSLTFPATAP